MCFSAAAVEYLASNTDRQRNMKFNRIVTNCREGVDYLLRVFDFDPSNLQRSQDIRLIVNVAKSLLLKKKDPKLWQTATVKMTACKKALFRIVKKPVLCLSFDYSHLGGGVDCGL